MRGSCIFVFLFVSFLTIYSFHNGYALLLTADQLQQENEASKNAWNTGQTLRTDEEIVIYRIQAYTNLVMAVCPLALILMVLRRAIRKRDQIKETGFCFPSCTSGLCCCPEGVQDCCEAFWCHCCVAAQLLRHEGHSGDKYSLCSTQGSPDEEHGIAPRGAKHAGSMLTGASEL